MPEDKDNWRAVVNTVMNISVPYNVGFFEWLSNWWIFKKASASFSYLLLERIPAIYFKPSISVSFHFA
jgi:hypothetical protein